MRFPASGAVLLLLAAVVTAIDFNSNDDASIKSCSQQYAYGLMSTYRYNDTSLPATQIGYFPKPHYWWESGAIWGGLIEFSQIFGDTSYVKTVQQALVANYGPNNDVIQQDKRDQQGNDDQAFWCLATMSALEYGFPEPATAPATYQQVTENCFKNIISRWDNTTCGGGLKWQIYPENSYGYNYKNAISNGAAFALAARLARYTGKSEYSVWANTIYDWTKKVGLIGADFEVFDGTDDKTNCASISDKTEWTYNNAMFLHGSAFMYDVTKGDNTWKDRTDGFLNRAAKFFQNPDNAQGVMFEVCEPSSKGCNLDQQSFKAYLGRWMAKTAILAPFTKDTVTNYLTKSAAAAAKACSGGSDGKTCGMKWYTGSFDNVSGLGQQLSALEVTQALAMIKKNTLPGTGSSAPGSSPSAAPSATSSQAASSSSKPATTSAAQPSGSNAAATTSTSPTNGGLNATSSECSCKKTTTVYVPPTTATAPPASSSSCSTRATVTTYVQPSGPVVPPPSSSSSSSCSTKATVTTYVQPSSPTVPPISSTSSRCTTKTTLTVVVPPSSSTGTAPPTTAPPTTMSTSMPVVSTTPTVPTTTRNATTTSKPPPANASIPVLFPGAASGRHLAGSTLFVAVALAGLSALL